MDLTNYQFNMLTHQEKGEVIITSGIFIDSRRHDEYLVALYGICAFYVEVFTGPILTR